MRLRNLQGSGWGWLAAKPDGSLSILTTGNQDPVYSVDEVRFIVHCCMHLIVLKQA